MVCHREEIFRALPGRQRGDAPQETDMTGNRGLFDQPSCSTNRSRSPGHVGDPVPARLPARDEEDLPLERLADLLAGRLAERLAPLLTSSAAGQPEGLVDAHEIARRMGRSRWWVYDHAGELGAVRLGCGPRERLGFWPARADAYLKAAADLRAPLPSPPRARPRPRRSTHTPVELLTFTRPDERATDLSLALGRD